MRIAAIGIDIERIQAEITQIEGPEKAHMTAAHAERANAYFSYFKNLKSEQQTLEELYAPMKARLAERGASQERDLEFVIRWEADLDQWLARGSVLFDQRRTIPHGTMQDLQKAAGRSRTAI